jgi:hypothetical protein
VLIDDNWLSLRHLFILNGRGSPWTRNSENAVDVVVFCRVEVLLDGVVVIVHNLNERLVFILLCGELLDVFLGLILEVLDCVLSLVL